PRGVLVTSASQGETILWNPSTGRILRRFPIGGPLSLSPDGRLVALGQNNDNPDDPSALLAVLDLRTGTHRSFETLPVNADTPCQAIDPHSTLMATTQADGTIALIDLRRLRLLDTLPAKNGSATFAVAFLPDGRTLATGGINGNVTLWDVRTRSVVRTLHLP